MVRAQIPEEDDGNIHPIDLSTCIITSQTINLFNSHASTDRKRWFKESGAANIVSYVRRSIHANDIFKGK